MNKATLKPKSITFSDGHTLAYYEFGDPSGKPLVNCHGGVVSGLDIMFADAAAKKAGVRIISPNRAGIGGSTFQANRSLLAWPQDVTELTQQLGIKRFAVLGWSMGGPYAMACAYALPKQVTHLIVVAGCLELSQRKNFTQLNPMDKRFSRMCHSQPMLARTVYWSTYKTAEHVPKFFTKSSARKLSKSDAQVIMSEPVENFARPATEALKHSKGLVEEYKVFVEPFGFNLQDIKVKTDIWQGMDDNFVPPAWATKMHKAIPKSKLHMVKGAGHFVAHQKIDDILASI